LSKSPIYFRLAVVIILCFCLATSASAQQLFTLKGIIFRKNTPQVITQATINDVTHKTISMSDELGGFHIEVAMGDTLVFKKADYAVETLVVQSRVDLSVYMQPVIQLNEVTIKDVSKQQELNNVLNDYKRTGQYYTLDPSAWSIMNSPLTGLYELFGKKPEQAKKFRQFSKEEMERVAISKRYNKTLVKQITSMPDSEIQDFMLAFTPSYEDIKIWTDYDIINYIKRSFEYFKNHKNSLKIEKLY
jgi:hypothetical protein